MVTSVGIRTEGGIQDHGSSDRKIFEAKLDKCKTLTSGSMRVMVFSTPNDELQLRVYTS